MMLRAPARLLAEDDLDILERGVIGAEPAARDTRAILLPAARFGKADIDQRSVAKVGETRHIEQTALIARIDSGHAGDRRCGERASAADEAQAPFTLGDERVAVRKKRNRPGMREPLRQHLNLQSHTGRNSRRSRLPGKSG